MPDIDINELREKLDVVEAELQDLQKKLQDPQLPKDPQKYKQVSTTYSEVKEKKDVISELVQTAERLEENRVLAENESDDEMLTLVSSDSEKLQEKLLNLHERLVDIEEEKDPYDQGNAIVEIRAGTGGDESNLFTQEMFRAYSKFAEAQGYAIAIASVSYGSAGGYKEIVFFVEGKEAYKTLKFESGVHRVQRVPETESSGRIHTSAVSVVVLPEIPEADINIDPNDLRIDVYRSSGPGGQSVNTTDSAVRIVHEPTGIVVTCQDEKSQHKNKAKALKILTAKLHELAEEESADKVGEIRQQAIKTGDRSAKIRTYNFPQSRVTDHRIKESWHNLGEVLEGNFSEIIAALHKYNRDNTPAQK
jgi:peptide chain release factor 1